MVVVVDATVVVVDPLEPLDAVVAVEPPAPAVVVVSAGLSATMVCDGAILPPLTSNTKN